MRFLRKNWQFSPNCIPQTDPQQKNDFLFLCCSFCTLKNTHTNTSFPYTLRKVQLLKHCTYRLSFTAVPSSHNQNSFVSLILRPIHPFISSVDVISYWRKIHKPEMCAYFNPLLPVSRVIG